MLLMNKNCALNLVDEIMKKNMSKYQFFSISARREDRFFWGGREPSDRVLSQSSSKQSYVRKSNPAMYAKHKRFGNCTERNALIGLIINHIITLSPALP